MKILLSGGGTAGSVSPLLAVADEIQKNDKETKFLWIGGKVGPEQEMVATHNIEFKKICAGKLRRYFSLKNLIDIFRIKIGFLQAFFIILNFKPDVIVSAGSFISVPIVWAGWLLRKKILIHQQDIRPGLANKLMAPFADKITVSFSESLKDYSKEKTILTGNPVRNDIFLGDKKRAVKLFNLEDNLPTVLIVGGGTGAINLNKFVLDGLNELTKFCQVIHITGKGKHVKVQNNKYHQYDFLKNEFADAIEIADLVVSRAGLGSLTELSALKKPAIIIPLAKSHQEVNAKYFVDKDAVVYFKEEKLSTQKFVSEIKNLLYNKEKLNHLKNNIYKFLKSDASILISKEIFSLK